MTGEIEKTNYEFVATIDGCQIYANKENGYFLFEHYEAKNGWYATPVLLGRTGKEVHKTMSNAFDWNYRLWHGEMAAIIAAGEQADALPTI